MKDKPKAPPVDLSRLIGAVQIESVRVVEAHLRTAVRSPLEAGPIEGKIGRRAKVKRMPENGAFVVRVDFAFGAHPAGDSSSSNGQAVIAVDVSFELAYVIPADLKVTKAELNEFATLNGIFNAWPYFREFVHAALARMGLPPITIPVYRLKPSVKTDAKTTSKKDTSVN